MVYRQTSSNPLAMDGTEPSLFYPGYRLACRRIPSAARAFINLDRTIQIIQRRRAHSMIFPSNITPRGVCREERRPR